VLLTYPAHSARRALATVRADAVYKKDIVKAISDETRE
jgi:hypothetical protein